MLSHAGGSVAPLGHEVSVEEQDSEDEFSRVPSEHPLQSGGFTAPLEHAALVGHCSDEDDTSDPSGHWSQSG